MSKILHKPIPLKPRPHQKAAIAAAVKELRKSGRSQVIMACATGKTLVGPSVTDRMKARKLLIFVPSLLLARQLLEVYRRQWPTASFLGVCSDMDRKATEDSPSIDDLGCAETTDRQEVQKFLRMRGRRVVIATYQSARVLKGLSFDGAIFDEAHRTAGTIGKPFSFGLHNKNVKCKWRLFMTATPRHAKISEDGQTTPVYSMDDPAVYGPVSYELSFREAIKRGLICDYRIVISVFNSRNRPGPRAVQVALRRAMSRYKASKVFTFHNTVAAAQEFVESGSALRGVSLSHVNGKQLSAVRAKSLRAFDEADNAIMSNVRCLTEGVDLPSVDMVAFLSTKKSTIEIVQACGRGFRKSPGKKRALIFLPIFVKEKEGEKLEEATKRTGFDTVHEVIQALREQDTALSTELKTISENGNESLIDSKHIALDVDPGVVPLATRQQIQKYVTVRLLRPFTDSTSTQKKKELLKLAKSGAPRPSSTSSLAWALLHYTRPEQSYDEDFDQKIRAVPSNWFQDTLEQKKKELLKLIKDGASRPSRKATDPHEKVLDRALNRYINQGPSYDEDFDQEIHAVPSNWFSLSSAQKKKKRNKNKKELLKLIKDGAPRPIRRATDPHEKSLAWALMYYIRRRGSSYDEDFVQEIRAVPSNWFRKFRKTK